MKSIPPKFWVLIAIGAALLAAAIAILAASDGPMAAFGMGVCFGLASAVILFGILDHAMASVQGNFRGWMIKLSGPAALFVIVLFAALLMHPDSPLRPQKGGGGDDDTNGATPAVATPAVATPAAATPAAATPAAAPPEDPPPTEVARREEATADAPPPAAGGGLLLLHSWYSHEKGDNFATTAPTWVGRPGDVRAGGYGYVRSEGCIFDPEQPQPGGTIALYSWWSPGREDNYLTTHPLWIGERGATRSPDYSLTRKEGYIYTEARAATTPLHGWFSGGRGDNMSTTDSRWHGSDGDTRSPDYRHSRVHGYVVAPGPGGVCGG